MLFEQMATLLRSIAQFASRQGRRVLPPLVETEAIMSRRKSIWKGTVAGLAGGLAAMNEFHAGWSARRGALCRCRRDRGSRAGTRLAMAARNHAARQPVSTVPPLRIRHHD